MVRAKHVVEGVKKHKHTKEPAFKKHLKNLHLDKQKGLKEQAKRVREEQKAVEKHNNTLNDKGKPYWEEVMANADKWINDSVSGYNQWEIIMFGLLSHTLVDAMWYDPIEIKHLPIVEEICDFGMLAWRYTVGPVGKAIGRAIDRASLDDSDLPEVRFRAGLNEKGHLISDITVGDEPALVDLIKPFDVGIVAWAKAHDYTCESDKENPNQVIFKDESGTKMTNEKFKELNDDPFSSLEAFLSNRFELNVKHTHSSSPS